MTEIRACTPADIPAVANLFQKTFRKNGGAAPASLQNYLRDLFVQNPWQNGEPLSRVFVSSAGAVGGFIGVLPLAMSFRGQTIRAAVAGSLMVDDPRKHPMAGARLLRSFLSGPQDLSLSETANPVSQAMWEKLGGTAIPGYSMEWLRVLRPAGCAVALLGERFSPGRLLGPLGSAIDRLSVLVARNPFAPAAFAADAIDVDIHDERLSQAIQQFARVYDLRPDWNDVSLRWVLDHAAAKERHGRLYCRIVMGRRGEAVGCYLYYGRPRRIAWVLQVLALPAAVDSVIENLFVHAFEHGSVAVRGRSQPWLLDALLRHRSILMHRASTVVRSANPDLVRAIASGDALIIGLAGEAWTRLIGGRFV